MRNFHGHYLINNGVNIGAMLVLMLGLMISSAIAAPSYDTVKSTNENEAGYILVGTGLHQGSSEIGEWVKAGSIEELKGAKGDKGDQGIQGIQGEKGDKGDKGDNGKDVDPSTVLNLQNADTVLDSKVSAVSLNQTAWNSRQDVTLKDHEARITDNTNKINDVDRRVQKLEKTQYVVETEVRLLDTKHMSVAPFVRHNATRGKLDTVGVRVTMKIGQSYEERELAKTNKRLAAVEAYLALPEVKEAVEAVKMSRVQVQTNGASFRVDKGF
jgi:hypothetical protein